MAPRAQFTLYLPLDMRQKIEEIAQRENRSISQMIRLYIERGLKESTQQKAA